MQLSSSSLTNPFSYFFMLYVAGILSPTSQYKTCPILFLGIFVPVEIRAEFPSGSVFTIG